MGILIGLGQIAVITLGTLAAWWAADNFLEQTL